MFIGLHILIGSSTRNRVTWISNDLWFSHESRIPANIKRWEIIENRVAWLSYKLTLSYVHFS